MSHNISGLRCCKPLDSPNLRWNSLLLLLVLFMGSNLKGDINLDVGVTMVPVPRTPKFLDSWCKCRTCSNWSYSVSNETQNQSLQVTLVNPSLTAPHPWNQRTRPEHQNPFRSQGSVFQGDLVLKPLKPALNPKSGRQI